jgi:phage shock protein PspC (stress-responsive transcriptional regulator)
MKNHKLYRSSTNRVLAGVCAGLADYFNIDPIIVRLLFLVFLFAGFGIIIYIIAWIFIPTK